MLSSPSSCSFSSPPILRSSWARGVLHKIEHDRCLAKIDRSRWYRLSRSNLLHEEFKEKFQQFDEDEETKDFLQQSKAKSESIPKQIVQSLLLSLFTLFITRTSGKMKLSSSNCSTSVLLANGLLHRGRMFVFSTPQFRTLIDFDETNSSTKRNSLLDIGAADGSVTDRMSTLFEQTFVTEMSPTMRWRLANKGYTVLDVDHWPNRTFDVITCLNVLDRCEKPLSLLEKIRRHLHPQHGRLVISLVLPVKQYFEYNDDHRPDESLHLHGDYPEEQINDLLSRIFRPLGFALKKFTRLPYLCEGDLERSYYFLFDYLFVFEMTPMS